METNLVSENTYTVYELLSAVTVPDECVDAHGVAAIHDGRPVIPPILGVMPGEHPWFGRRRLHHWPWEAVCTSPAEAVAKASFYGQCSPVVRVRDEYGGGFLALRGVPEWLIHPEPVGWKHDGRFHSRDCPERAAWLAENNLPPE
jgi:hypothetical protein